MAAAGWAKTTEQVRVLTGVPQVTHIVIGSYTVQPREGNTGGETFAVLRDGTSVNARGLPNRGVPYLRAHGREMAQIAHDAGKQLVVSGAWFTPTEAGVLAATAFEIGADVYEDNCGCPNVWEGGKQKAIPSFDLDLMGEADWVILRATGSGSVIWKKLSPYTNPEERVRVAAYLSEREPNGVVCCNTLPNARLRGEDGKPLITAEGTSGLGGMGGTALFLLALTNAEHFRELLPNNIDVIGCGGIRSGMDVRDYRLIGCVGVQVGTAFFQKESAAALQSIGEWAMYTRAK